MASRKRKQSETAAREAGESAAQGDAPTAHPPPKRFGVLAAVIVLLCLWLIYLSYVAWRVAGA